MASPSEGITLDMIRAGQAYLQRDTTNTYSYEGREHICISAFDTISMIH